MALPPVYSKKLAIGQVATDPGDNVSLFVVPAGVVYVVRTIAAEGFFGSSTDEVVAQAIDFTSSIPVDLDDYSQASMPNRTRIWFGPLVMNPQDILLLRVLSGSGGGYVRAWVSGYQLSLP